MDEQPGRPRCEAREMKVSDLGYALRTADRGHAALVPIAERFTGLLCNAAPNLFGSVLTHLNGNRSYSRNGSAILLKMGEIADDEDFRISLKIEAVINGRPATAVDVRVQGRAERRGLHTGSPNRYLR